MTNRELFLLLIPTMTKDQAQEVRAEVEHIMSQSCPEDDVAFLCRCVRAAKIRLARED